MPAMDSQYYIEDGVHRAVAARENGLRMIPAVLFVDGQPPQALLAPLKDLHSPRSAISRSNPRYRYDVLKAAMATVSGRARMPPISLQPLGVPGQTKSVPLDQVQIQS